MKSFAILCLLDGCAVKDSATTTEVPTIENSTGLDSTGSPIPTEGSGSGPGDCEVGPGAPEDVLAVWRKPGEQGKVQIFFSAATDTCGGLPTLSCPDVGAALQGYVLTLSAAAQAPGVYSLATPSIDPPALLGLSYAQDYGDGCMDSSVYFDSGEVEVFNIDAECIALAIRNVKPIEFVGPFEPNGSVSAPTCS